MTILSSAPCEAGSNISLRQMPRLTVVACAVCLALAGTGVGIALGLSRHQAQRPTGIARDAAAPSRAVTGWPFDRPVPSLPLVDASGRPTSLDSLRGRIVVLAPSLTLCGEVCPMTTGALAAMRQVVVHDGLGRRVAFVEVSVDPWRDSPARLRAYERDTGVRLIELTGDVSQLRRFWRFFGIGFRRVPQGHPPDMDWWTHRPESFDVEHADGVFVIDARGRERDFFPGPANMRGRLSPQLRSLLSAEGKRNLSRPVDAWTTSEVLASVGRLLGRRVTAAG
jgi:cytochrome oxidase Cu insertion factor (SCO1/SenC/PrrC family)